MSLTHEEVPHARDVRTTRDARLRPPTVDDGAQMWRVARDSGELDLNSSYAYLLYARDFARTCRVAVLDGAVAGFVLGYLRQEQPETLFVWQVAIDEAHRGRGLSGAMLDDLVAGLNADGAAVTSLETTITDDNVASQRLFASFARRHGAEIDKSGLFESAHFPDGHEAEPLYRIHPLGAGLS